MKQNLSVLLVLGALAAGAEVVAWNTPEALSVWTKRGHQVSSAEVSNGVLKVVCGGTDAHLYSDGFSIAASPVQEVVFRAKGNVGGFGELFWMKPGEGPTQNLSTSFEWIGDGAWHTYRIRPFWQGEKRIGQLRLDFPTGAFHGGVYEISSVAVEETAPALSLSAERNVGLAFDAVAQEDGAGSLTWASSAASGKASKGFRFVGDGRRHSYYLNLSDEKRWAGTILWTNLVSGGATLSNVRFVAEEPILPADLAVRSVRAEDAFNRVGAAVPVRVFVENLGTCTAKHVAVTPVDLPSGVRASRVEAGELCGLETGNYNVVFEVDSARTFTATFVVTADGVAPQRASANVTVLPSLGLEKASYVPEPKPVKTDYDIGALYFPGWPRVQAWQRVWNRCPERKPVLGWYDEANPECVDWQIKWLVENGIRTLYVDWYWHKGSQHLDHWVKAFQRAKYRHHLKWAMMWANHNAEGSHSIEDQTAVTKFWIENYFNTPEYLQIDGMPVVWMWSPQNMDRDMGPGGCRRLLDLSRRLAREAGYRGIYFIAMKWPEADCAPKTIQRYKDMGFDMTGIYHFMDHGGKAEDGRRFPYSLTADANPGNWWKQHEADILPFLPNLSTGWDDRPWNDHCEIYGKNVDDFRRICREAKKFADATGVKRLCLAPLNEWGEGSYAEPNAEHGFGFYEAVRDTFCEKPAEGWPLNYGPKDVGLGPYDLPPPAPPARVTSWTFNDANTRGWHAMMGVGGFAGTASGLAFKTDTRDPAIAAYFAPVEAKNFKEVVVRMKVEGNAGSCQLFWAGPGGRPSETTSLALPVVADGAVHEYRFPVASRASWRARVNHLRFDPACAPGVKVVIESILMK